MGRRRRLLSIAHSYCVALNRRLAHEMTRAGGDEWEVTAAAPARFHGELSTAPEADEPCRLALLPVHFTRKPQLMWYGRGLRGLMSEGWDLVHCWEEPYTVAAGQIARLTDRHVPFVFWTAQNISKRYPTLFARIERYTLERSTGWMACGKSIEETMLTRGYGRRPYRIMPLGVDLSKFRPDPAACVAIRNRLGWAIEGPPVVGYLGRLVREKGLPHLTRVLDRLSGPWRALIVGGGPLEASLRSWSARYGDRVRIVPGLRHHQVPAYLAAMDILCAPSRTTRTWREQFGRMIIEGFATGLAVVASRSGEIPYVVGDGGLVLGESDEAGWARTLDGLIDAPAQRRELGARGLERARENYAWPLVARRHLDFFSEMIAAHAAR